MRRGRGRCPEPRMHGAAPCAYVGASQLAWFAGAAVLITPHGAANALAAFADRHALVVEVLPYAYRPEAPVR